MVWIVLVLVLVIVIVDVDVDVDAGCGRGCRCHGSSDAVRAVAIAPSTLVWRLVAIATGGWFQFRRPRIVVALLFLLQLLLGLEAPTAAAAASVGKTSNARFLLT